MGMDDEFGPDTETIRSWLAQRSTYTGDARVIGAPRGTAGAPAPLRDTSADASPAPRPATAAPIDERDIGRSILDAIGASSPTTEPARPATEPKAQQPTGTSAPAPSAGTGESRWQEPERARSVGTNIEFPVRSGLRRVMSLILLVCVAGTAVAAYLASREQTPVLIGVAVILGFLTLVVWSVRASGTTTRLSIHRGRLTVQRGGASEIVDIGNRYTPLAMIGEPGDRHWTVLVERPGQPLLVITKSMVDPALFTEVLYRLRPELNDAS